MKYVILINLHLEIYDSNHEIFDLNHSSSGSYNDYNHEICDSCPSSYTPQTHFSHMIQIIQEF